jgi:hypothetical protein
MDHVYDRYGIVPKPWFAAKGSESKNNSYYVMVWGWSRLRRIIKRDGLISFQVTVHHRENRVCDTCAERIRFVKQQLADQNVACFWTAEPDYEDFLFVTVGPKPPRTSVERYLSRLIFPMIRYRTPRKNPSKQLQTEAAGRNNRHIVQ